MSIGLWHPFWHLALNAVRYSSPGGRVFPSKQFSSALRIDSSHPTTPPVNIFSTLRRDCSLAPSLSAASISDSYAFIMSRVEGS